MDLCCLSSSLTAILGLEVVSSFEVLKSGARAEFLTFCPDGVSTQLLLRLAARFTKKPCGAYRRVSVRDSQLFLLLVVSGVMRQRFAALGTGGSSAGTAGAAIGASVVPYTCLVLCRFWFGRNRRFVCASRGCGGGVVGRVVCQRGAAFCTRDSCPSTTCAALRASVMPHTSRVLRRLCFFGIRRRRNG